MKIFLCRHGETTSDVEDRYGGDYEDHLTEKGRFQAEELGVKLADKNIEIIWTSPRIRARETAEIINRKLKTDIRLIEEFKERNHYGVLTGMIKSEAKKMFPDDVEAVKSYKTKATNGEDYLNFSERIRRGLKKIENSESDSLCLVTHGGAIRFIFREILKFGEINVNDCAYAELDFSDGVLKVLNLNGISKKTE